MLSDDEGQKMEVVMVQQDRPRPTPRKTVEFTVNLLRDGPLEITGGPKENNIPKINPATQDLPYWIDWFFF